MDILKHIRRRVCRTRGSLLGFRDSVIRVNDGRCGDELAKIFSIPPSSRWAVPIVLTPVLVRVGPVIPQGVPPVVRLVVVATIGPDIDRILFLNLWEADESLVCASIDEVVVEEVFNEVPIFLHLFRPGMVI